MTHQRLWKELRAQLLVAGDQIVWGRPQEAHVALQRARWVALELELRGTQLSLMD